MTEKISRRDALKLGTSAAVTATVSPLLTSAPGRAGPVAYEQRGSNSTDMAPAGENGICFMQARDLAAMIRGQKISSREVMQAHLKQIARVNSKVNAIVTLVPEDQLMAQALAADEAVAKGNWMGPLHGMPVGVKDLHATKGIRTTYGSPLHARDVPNFDCLMVEREKKGEGIVIGRRKVREGGLGRQSLNRVLALSLNHYDLTKPVG